jgi:hypothetical protein
MWILLLQIVQSRYLWFFAMVLWQVPHLRQLIHSCSVSGLFSWKLYSFLVILLHLLWAHLLHLSQSRAGSLSSTSLLHILQRSSEGGGMIGGGVGGWGGIWGCLTDFFAFFGSLKQMGDVSSEPNQAQACSRWSYRKCYWWLVKRMNFVFG